MFTLCHSSNDQYPLRLKNDGDWAPFLQSSPVTPQQQSSVTIEVSHEYLLYFPRENSILPCVGRSGLTCGGCWWARLRSWPTCPCGCSTTPRLSSTPSTGAARGWSASRSSGSSSQVRSRLINAHNILFLQLSWIWVGAPRGPRPRGGSPPWRRSPTPPSPPRETSPSTFTSTNFLF